MCWFQALDRGISDLNHLPLRRPRERERERESVQNYIFNNHPPPLYITGRYL